MKSPEPSAEPCWYCLRTRPKHERIAAARLRTLDDVEVFSPQLRFKRSTKRGMCWFVEAMFPGYVFARFVFTPRYRQIQAVNGVTAILRFGQQYAILPDRIVEELRKHTGAEELIVIESAVETGDEVQIAAGPLAGVSAIVTRARPASERIRILLEMLGQQVEAEVRREDVLGKLQHPLAKRAR